MPSYEERIRGERILAELEEKWAKDKLGKTDYGPSDWARMEDQKLGWIGRWVVGLGCLAVGLICLPLEWLLTNIGEMSAQDRVGASKEGYVYDTHCKNCNVRNTYQLRPDRKCHYCEYWFDHDGSLEITERKL